MAGRCPLASSVANHDAVTGIWVGSIHFGQFTAIRRRS